MKAGTEVVWAWLSVVTALDGVFLLQNIINDDVYDIR